MDSPFCVVRTSKWVQLIPVERPLSAFYATEGSRALPDFHNALSTVTLGNTDRPSSFPSSPTISWGETDYGPKNAVVGHTMSAVSTVQHSAPTRPALHE